MNQTAKYTFLHPEVNDTVHKDPKFGYQPYEFILGNRGDSQAVPSTAVFKRDSRIGLPRPSMFGHCTNDYSLKFMENLTDAECVLQVADELTADVCTSMSYAN